MSCCAVTRLIRIVSLFDLTCTPDDALVRYIRVQDPRIERRNERRNKTHVCVELDRKVFPSAFFRSINLVLLFADLLQNMRPFWGLQVTGHSSWLVCLDVIHSHRMKGSKFQT